MPTALTYQPPSVDLVHLRPPFSVKTRFEIAILRRNCGFADLLPIAGLRRQHASPLVCSLAFACTAAGDIPACRHGRTLALSIWHFTCRAGMF